MPNRRASARDDGLRRLSALTAALALAAVVGTGIAVEKAQAYSDSKGAAVRPAGSTGTASGPATSSGQGGQSSGTQQTQPSFGSGGSTGSGGSSQTVQPPPAAPAPQQAPPVVVSSGS